MLNIYLETVMHFLNIYLETVMHFLNIYLETVMHFLKYLFGNSDAFFQDSLMNRKFKRTEFI